MAAHPHARVARVEACEHVGAKEDERAPEHKVRALGQAVHVDEHRARLDEESLEAATSAARLAAEEAAAALASSLEPDAPDPPAVGRAPAQPKAGRGSARTSEWRP